MTYGRPRGLLFFSWGLSATNRLRSKIEGRTLPAMPSKGWVSIAPSLSRYSKRVRAGNERQRVQKIRLDRLSHALTSGNVIAFVGSGCSMPFHYPSWDELALELGREARRHLEERRGLGEWTLDRFTALSQRFGVGEADSSGSGGAPTELSKPEKYALLSIAQEILDRPELASGSDHDTPYQAYFRQRLSSLDKPAAAPGSTLRRLLELPVRRFVTTNYDEELERALGLPLATPGEAWFTQELEYLDQLTLFALAREDREDPVVFHCHGHYRRPRSIIATERDYQRWYVNDAPPDLASLEESSRGSSNPTEAAAFRQTLELLMGSNPIVFVGAGLGEDDLLRPVRLLSALEPRRLDAGQLFALRPRRETGEDDLALEALNERYGIQVISFDWPSPRFDSEDAALAQKLEELRARYTSYSRRAAAKPKLRRAWAGAAEDLPPRHYWHYLPTEAPGGARLGAERLRQQLAELRRSFEPTAGDGSTPAQPPASVLMLVGRGGTGKSFLATELLREQATEGATSATFTRSFFWSSYYADDLLSGVDRLLGFLGLRNQGSHRLTQLLELFEGQAKNTASTTERTLLVLDGIERLLVPIDHPAYPDVGRPSNEAVRKFFAAIARPHPEIQVVLTTRLIPSLYIDEERSTGAVIHCHDGILKYDVRRADWEDLRDLPPFDLDDLPAAHLARLCSLLEGHRYGLALAASVLAPLSAESVAALRQRLEDLCARLAEHAPGQRIGAMIRSAVEQAETEAHQGVVREIMRHLAAHLSPVGPEVLDLCLDQAEGSAGSYPRLSQEQRQHLLGALRQRRLIFLVSSHGGRDRQQGWTLHPTVRSFLFESDENLPGELLPNFTMAGFTSGTGVVHPKSPQVRAALKQLFYRLIEQADEAASRGESALAKSLCRSAYSTVRSRMEANTVSRWTSYPEYAHYLIELIDLAKDLSGTELWDWSDPRHLSLVESDTSPLYADELAWLYNELGLVFCSEGNMRETYRLWEQGYEINRVIEQGLRPHAQYVVQSLLHLSHTFIELGRLDLASEYLHDTHRANLDFGDEDYKSRILGYRALLAHLQSDFERADAMYQEALDMLREARRNPRAEAIFSRFHADLRMHQDDLEGGRRLLERSRALSDAANYPDLVAFCRNSLGRYYRAKGRPQDALREYQAAWASARRFGIRRLEADALSEMSRLALGLGDTAVARQHALRALRLANELGLGLRQVHGLVVLGLAAVAEKKLVLGKSYLRHARDLAFKRRYYLRGYEAQRKLEELGEPPGGPMIMSGRSG